MKILTIGLVVIFIILTHLFYTTSHNLEKKVVPVEKHPVLKSKEELKQELIQEIKIEREKQDVKR